MNRKLRKELIDQPLHALWAAASVFAIGAPWHWLEPPFAGVVTGWGVVSLVVLCLREVFQRSANPGFPTLDVVAGYVPGTVLGILGVVLVYVL